ncbi:alpha/beta hydrolase [Frankia sp. Ag45/Mut15]|uniref:Alpha/beta hydrolase n=1 Tax=Frankia umida TaxID=573489 RepID=A0ABT0K0Y9_9ACTN|nr:alpha/beta hydrolase [Frankia umida]MCK9877470.1 alpha/beta hydrolase [Frankia umida]
MTSPLHPTLPAPAITQAPPVGARGPIAFPPVPLVLAVPPALPVSPETPVPPVPPVPSVSPVPPVPPGPRVPRVEETGPAGVWPSPARSPSGGVAVVRREVRSVLAALPGRGQNARDFDALTERLALDGHQLVVVTDGAVRIPAVVETRMPGVPFVLLGADTGALEALSMVGSPAVRPDGLVLLGLPSLHTAVAEQPIVESLPRALPDLPILLLHGGADEVSPLPLVRMVTRTAPRTELAVVAGGHDPLVGPGRRSVAARTVLFLEGLLAAGQGSR